MVNSIWDGSTGLYEKALKVRSGIHETVASNLANEETPGYRARLLPFRQTLAAVQRGESPLETVRTHPRHIPLVSEGNEILRHAMLRQHGGGLDGNTVNLEEEVTRMAQNSMMYMAASQFLKGRFDGWAKAIGEGRSG